MAVIREQDLGKGRGAFEQWQDAAHNIFSEQLPADDDTAFDFRLNFSPRLPRQLWAMAVRYSLYLLEKKAPGEGVEVRVAPWGAIKILDGPASDPHNLTPPDVIELDPDVWMRLATGNFSCFNQFCLIHTKWHFEVARFMNCISTDCYNSIHRWLTFCNCTVNC